MKPARPYVLLLVLLIVFCAGWAARIDIWFMRWPGNREATGNPLKVMIGQAQNLLAPMAYREADVYFHSGFYPSIFDNGSAFRTEHIATEAGAAVSRNTGDDATFLGKPLDFIDAFSRHFYPTVHTHLSDGGAASAYGPAKSEHGTNSLIGEILPWLWLSLKLNHDQPQVYDVTAYWLIYMHRYHSAVNVLLQGLRYNTNNPDLWFELGEVYFANYHNLTRARNIWEAALQFWHKQTGDKPLAEKLSLANTNFHTRFTYERLQSHLALLEEQAGNLPAAIAHWEKTKLASPNPANVQKHIDALKQKLAASSAGTNRAPP